MARCVTQQVSYSIHLIEKAVKPKQRRIDASASRGLAFLCIGDRTHAGADLFRDSWYRKPPQTSGPPDLTQAVAPFQQHFNLASVIGGQVGVASGHRGLPVGSKKTLSHPIPTAWDWQLPSGASP